MGISFPPLNRGSSSSVKIAPEARSILARQETQLNCTNAIHEISSYIDGELEASVRIELEEHLHECEGCAIVVRQTQLTVEIFCNDKAVELPPKFARVFMTL